MEYIRNENSGVINFGETLNISPKSISKSVSGSGGSNSGDFTMTINGVNVNNTLDPDVVDQNIAGNI